MPAVLPVTIDVHLEPDDLADALRARRAPRPHRRRRRGCRRSGSTTSAAASSSTRSPGCPSTTRPGPNGRSSTRGPPRSPRDSAPTRWSSSARARRRRPALLLDAFAARARCGASCPFDVSERRPARRRATIADRVPGPRRARRGRRLRPPPRRAPRRRAGGWSRSSAARSATSTPPSGRRFLARPRRTARTRRPLAARHRPGEGPRPAGRRLRRRRRA